MWHQLDLKNCCLLPSNCETLRWATSAQALEKVSCILLLLTSCCETYMLWGCYKWRDVNMCLFYCHTFVFLFFHCQIHCCVRELTMWQRGWKAAVEWGQSGGEGNHLWSHRPLGEGSVEEMWQSLPCFSVKRAQIPPEISGIAPVSRHRTESTHLH